MTLSLGLPRFSSSMRAFQDRDVCRAPERVVMAGISAIVQVTPIEEIISRRGRSIRAPRPSLLRYRLLLDLKPTDAQRFSLAPRQTLELPLEGYRKLSKHLQGQSLLAVKVVPQPRSLRNGFGLLKARPNQVRPILDMLV